MKKLDKLSKIIDKKLVDLVNAKFLILENEEKAIKIVHEEVVQKSMEGMFIRIDLLDGYTKQLFNAMEVLEAKLANKKDKIKKS